MAIRSASATWKGNLTEGSGSIQLPHGRFDQPYSAGSRFEQGQGTNPEELIAGAHAGCFSMALSHALAESGYRPESVQTEARVSLEKSGDGFAVTTIDLSTVAVVPGIEDDAFQSIANDAKTNCPVSKALSGCHIRLTARLA